MNHEQDAAIRNAAFNWLDDQTTAYGDVLPRRLLQQGFIFGGQRIPLVAPQGIFKPQAMALPLTITTTPHGPYDDAFNETGFLLYKYRGTDPRHRDNIGLRTLFQEQRPLIYFHGILPGRYLAAWPIFIIGDNPETLTFTVAVDERATLHSPVRQLADDRVLQRSYQTQSVRVRLHQRRFREIVLDAYRSHCTICRLKHRELLDAAHIIPDHEPDSRPTVNNGLALCKLHHAAYDRMLLGISPDYKIIIRADILEEEDGPVLKHGLQGLHESMLWLPRRMGDRPDQDALARRFEQFETA